MTFWITPKLKNTLPSFSAVMALKGEVYRQLENRCTQRVALDSKNYFLKQHFGVGYFEIIKNLTQGKLPIVSAKTEWLAIQRCQALGISVPTVAGFGKSGWNPAAIHSFLLTEACEHTISLEEYTQNWASQKPRFVDKLALLKAVALIAKTLHRNHMNHRDFYLCHFLLDNQTQNHLTLIDLHRAQIHRNIPLRWIIKDLAGLFFSTFHFKLTQRDIFRFINFYSDLPLMQSLKDNHAFWNTINLRATQLFQKHGL